MWSAVKKKKTIYGKDRKFEYLTTDGLREGTKAVCCVCAYGSVLTETVCNAPLQVLVSLYTDGALTHEQDWHNPQ